MHKLPHSLRLCFDWFFRDKNGSVVIYQRPNLPIIAWLFFTFLAMILNDDRAVLSGILAQISLSIWSLLEISFGDSIFRRVLGTIVGIGLLLSIASISLW